MIFVDRRLTNFFGRAPDIQELIGRAKSQGLTAVAGRPKMGKTWLLTQAAFQLSNADYLLGYHESKGQDPDLMLRAVADLYENWLSNASYWQPAKSLRKRHKDRLITGAGQVVGRIFEAIADPRFGLAGVGKLVRETFDELARADTDLRTGGLQLPRLDYETARELV